MAREILSKKEQKLYDRLAKIIPGFNPVLDEVALTIYVTLLRDREKLTSKIEAAESKREKQLLSKILGETEQQLQAWAAKLGLTPASRLEIMRNLRLRPE